MITYESTLNVARSYDEHNDCTVKAVAIACNIPYIKAHKALADAGRINRKGAYVPQIITAVRALGFNLHPVKKTTAKTVSSLHKQLPAFDKYLVLVNSHALAYAKGSIHDWTGDPDRKPSRRRIEQIWLVTPLQSKNSIRKAKRYSK